MSFLKVYLTIPNIILVIALLGIFYGLFKNDLLYNSNAFIDYWKAKYSVRKTNIRMLVLNFSVFAIILLLYKNNNGYYDMCLTVLSILTSAIFFLLSSINNASIIDFYKETIDESSATPPKRFSETNNLSAGTLFIGTTLIMFIITMKIFGFENCKFINKFITIMLFIFMQNFLIITRRFTTIYCRYFKEKRI